MEPEMDPKRRENSQDMDISEKSTIFRKCMKASMNSHFVLPPAHNKTRLKPLLRTNFRNSIGHGLQSTPRNSLGPRTSKTVWHRWESNYFSIFAFSRLLKWPTINGTRTSVYTRPADTEIHSWTLVNVDQFAGKFRMSRFFLHTSWSATITMHLVHDENAQLKRGL